MLIKKTATSIVSIAAALVMYGIMKNTCPSREQHMTEVTNVMESILDKIFHEHIKVPEQSRKLADYLSSEVIPQAVEKLTNQQVDVTDYGVFSIGNLEDEEGGGHAVTIGLFGHVFTIGEQQTYDYLNEVFERLNLKTNLQEQE